MSWLSMRLVLDFVYYSSERAAGPFYFTRCGRSDLYNIGYCEVQ